MDARQIGQAIRDRRRTLQLSQGELAALASCSKPFVIAAEHGKSTLRLDKLLMVLAVLGLTLAVQPERDA